jgi:hypothetical protein
MTCILIGRQNTQFTFFVDSVIHFFFLFLLSTFETYLFVCIGTMGFFPLYCKNNVQNWHCQKLRSCDIHGWEQLIDKTCAMLPVHKFTQSSLLLKINKLQNYQRSWSTWFYINPIFGPTNHKTFLVWTFFSTNQNLQISTLIPPPKNPRNEKEKSYCCCFKSKENSNSI